MSTYSEGSILIKGGQQWPESIDADGKGNLYFSDGMEGTVYRIGRTDTTPGFHTKLVVGGFTRVGGISIDRRSQHLYVGIVPDPGEKEKGALVRLPLALLESALGEPAFDRANLLDESFRKDREILLVEGIAAPNGVVYSPSENVVYYTWERLGLESLLRKPGHIGRIELNHGDPELRESLEVFSPNGIDVAADEYGVRLTVAITLENRIIEFDPWKPDLSQAESVKLPRGQGRWIPPWTDGLIRMENGDLLIAVFGSGEILYLKREGKSFGKPTRLATVPGRPTDLVVAPSFSNESASLFVTYTQMGNIFNKSLRKGAVVEIPDIVAKLKAGDPQ